MTKPMRFGVLVLSMLLVGVAVAQTTVVTVEQRAKFQSDDIESGDRFGFSVGLDGDIIVVGAALESGGLGAVYVFDASDGGSQLAKLTASDAGGGNDNFGRGVAVSESHGLIFVGSSSDATASNAGAVYVFEGSGGSWSQSAKFQSDDIAAMDNFGQGLAYDASNDRLFVGASFEGTGGSVYVFEESGGSWSQTDKFTSGGVGSGDQFGRGLAYRASTLFVGAPFDDDSGGDAGSVYVFEESGGSWSQTLKFQSDDIAAGDNFGRGVAVVDDVLLVGAPLDDDTASDDGSVYVFEESGGSWSQTLKFQSDDIAAGDQFGSGVGLSGGLAVVGAPFDDDTASDDGSVYVFDFFVDEEPAADPSPGGGAPFFGDDGALFGGDKSALADSLQVTETALDFIMGIMLTLIFAAGGFLLLGLLGALMGAGFGFIFAFAFGLFPLWVLIFILVLAAAFYYLRSNANG